ncbi:hypothetical protein [Pistricoccus aurantiacus]|uniref:hypothetical protein n=1 Tax=Pistricoccus aurantiacus TaxID=1883414 RepID=UPI0036382BD3
MLLERDIDYRRACLGHFASVLLETRYAKKLDPNEAGKLQSDMPLTGHFAADTSSVDMDDLMEVIDGIRAKEANRQAPSWDEED